MVGTVRDYMSRNSWPAGVQSALIRGLQITPVRYLICDDSGSMMSCDGKRLVGEGATVK
jgi:hypothetical protein